MRKWIAILAVAVSVAACTPKEVAQVMHHPLPTKEDVQIAIAVTKAQPTITLSEAEFLKSAKVLHDTPFLACTRGHESDTAGGYRAFNPDGPYFGAYQFLQSTWNTSAAHAGFPQLVGTDILSVPGYYQDLVALRLYEWQGKSPWGGRC